MSEIFSSAALKSTFDSDFNFAPPAASAPSAVAPRAASIPAPASLVPLPPSPTVIVLAPLSIALAISSPTP